MTEQDNGPHDETSRTNRRRKLKTSLDYATWRAHLAAPGSRFESAVPETARIVRLDTMTRTAAAAGAERRTA